MLSGCRLILHLSGQLRGWEEGGRWRGGGSSGNSMVIGEEKNRRTVL